MSHLLSVCLPIGSLTIWHSTAFWGFFISSQLWLNLTATAQTAPEIVFQTSPRGTYDFVTRQSTWSNSESIGTGAFSGSFSSSGGTVSGDVMTFESESYCTSNGASIVGRWLFADESVRILVRDGGTVTVSASGDAETHYSAYGGSGGYARFGQLPYYGDVVVSVPGTGYHSISNLGSGSGFTKYELGCSPNTVVVPEYPGVSYSYVSGVTLMGAGLYCAGAAFNGEAHAFGSVTFSATRGASDPVAIISSPHVGGVPATPQQGSAVTFFNASYDPDDSSTPLDGICSVQWQFTDPIGAVTNGSNPGFNLNQFAFLPWIAGRYRVTALITDNEDATASWEYEFSVGPEREPQNDLNSEEEEIQCGASAGGAEVSGAARAGVSAAAGSDIFAAAINPGSGEVTFNTALSVPTRGLPLQGAVFYRTQTRESAPNVGLGNFTHAYGLRVLQGINASSQTTWWVQDGDGSQHLLGVGATPVNGREAGVYSSLVSTTNGYRLEGAGAPGSVHEAGNYTYYFDTAGKLTEVEDPMGNTHTLTYRAGDLLKVLDSSTGKTLSYEYNTPGQIARIVLGEGEANLHFTYSSHGQVTRIEAKERNGVSLRIADIEYFGPNDFPDETLIKKLTFDRDPGTAVNFTYQHWDEGLWLANYSTSKGASNYNYNQSPPSGVLHRVRKTNAKGGNFYYDYNSSGDLIKITGPTPYGATGPSIVTHTYNANRERISTVGNGNSQTFTYHPNGLLRRVTDGTGSYREYSYNGVNLTQVTTNSGPKLKLYYDNANFPNVPTRYEDGDGNIWRVTLNPFGQPLNVTPPSGSTLGVTTFTYNEVAGSPTFGYLTSVVNGAGDKVAFDDYTGLGDLTAISVEPLSGVTVSEKYDYDALGRLREEIHEDGTSTQYSYTGRDLAHIQDEALTAVNYSWCGSCGAINGVKEPLARTLSWTRDDDRQVTEFTDARGNITSYEYGSGGELKKIAYPDLNPSASFQEVNYNSSGLVRRLLRTLSSKTQDYTYDTAARLRTIAAQHATITFNYDSEGRVSSVLEHPGTQSFTYTGSSLVESDTYDFTALTNNQVLEYEYYADQLLKKLTWKDGTSTVATWTYEYDGAGRVERITNSFGEVTDYRYDRTGKVTRQDNGNGSFTEYVYNHSRGWPIEITHDDGAVTFEKFDIEYDGGANTVGLITKVDEFSGIAVKYEYDELYRLVAEGREGPLSYSQSLGYDLAGNVIKRNGLNFGKYDAVNEAVTVNGMIVSHDLDGGLENLQRPGNSLVTYGRDGFLFLSSMTQNGAARTFQYDHDGTLRVISWNGGSDKRVLLYDQSGRLLAELLNGVPYKAYTWGPTGPVSQRILTGTPTSSWYHLGPQGETRHLTGANGGVVASYHYTAYGERLGTIPAVDNPLQYGAKFGYYQLEGYNEELRVGSRFYLPSIMRWDTRDYINYSGGDNLYRYAEGNPVRYYDEGGRSPAVIGATLGPVGWLGVGLSMYCSLNYQGCVDIFRPLLGESRDSCEAPFPNIYAEDKSNRFKGGKKGKRDRFYGLENRPGFDDFKDWWHREGKLPGEPDIGSTEEAGAAWGEWEAIGRPKKR